MEGGGVAAAVVCQSVCVAILMANHSGIFLCIQHTTSLIKLPAIASLATCDSQGHKKANGRKGINHFTLKCAIYLTTIDIGYMAGGGNIINLAI